ncbi:MAG: HU family DNA-binding protein [Geodermatophilaceae bacterium]|nr:HU family DNA-binding protein [Geodermatophilaceae bacterium]
MNKSELIDTLATRMAGDKKTASAAVEGLIDVVSRAVSKGEKVAITGFGVFEKRNRSARTARNPRTGATIKVKKTSVPAFRPGQQFKDVVSGAKKLGKVATPPVVKAAATARTTKAASAAPAKSATKSTTAKATTAKASKASKASKATKASKTTTAKAAPAKKTATKTAATKSATKKTAAKTSPAKKAANTRARVTAAARTLATAPGAKTARKAAAKKSN